MLLQLLALPVCFLHSHAQKPVLFNQFPYLQFNFYDSGFKIKHNDVSLHYKKRCKITIFFALRQKYFLLTRSLIFHQTVVVLHNQLKNSDICNLANCLSQISFPLTFHWFKPCCNDLRQRFSPLFTLCGSNVSEGSFAVHIRSPAHRCFARSTSVLPYFSHISPMQDGRNMGEIWEN